MTSLDLLIPAPRLVEIDRVDLATPVNEVWDLVRHGDLARSPFIRALFALRSVPARWAGRPSEPSTIRIDDLVSSVERPGFQVLVDDPFKEFAVGAIGKVWQGDIPFVHVADAEAFGRFIEEGFVKVAWAVRVSPRGERASHLEFEVRVDATDDESWKKFRRYFKLIGPGSRFIRHSLLHGLARDLGEPMASENERVLPGDDLLTDAAGQITHFIDMAATPDAIWPWLLQLGCRRAGYYSIDGLDNAHERSAREIHPELQHLSVGDVIAATPQGDDGFEVLRLEPGRVLALGGLWDADAQRQLPFFAQRPHRFWHVTWTFVLDPLDGRSTRVIVRARAAFTAHEKLHLAWVRPVHHLMETTQLRHLAARAEGRLARDDWGDVLEGVRGAAIMTAALLTPFMRQARSHWGLDAATAERAYPGDDLIAKPRWQWTHGIEIAAPASEVWPWVAQVGADRAGFYSYQWLENVAGCGIRNAEVIRPEWEMREGDRVVLHPGVPPLPVVALVPGRHFVAHAPADAQARASGKPWVEATWLFYVEPLGPARCRFISRYRANTSDDVATRLSFGPTFIEPVGFAMDRRMLLGVKERVEHAIRANAPLRRLGISPQVGG